MGSLGKDRNERSLVLVGMMGAGKTTIGRRLAKRLAIPFTDADEEIEVAAGMTINEIFGHYGEAYFRDGEKRVIARLIGGPRQVIATGGGAFNNHDTRALILADATSIWLDAPLDTLVQRVSRRSTRPLLVGKDARVVLTDLLAQRGPSYALADITIRSDDLAHEAMVDRIIASLERLA